MLEQLWKLLPIPYLEIPKLGKNTPVRGNAFSRFLGKIGMLLSGWRILGDVPNLPKFVIIGAPHSSNWDFILFLMVIFGTGLRLSFLGKHTLFRAPFGGLMRWTGGISVDRRKRQNTVEQTAEAFNRNEKFALIIAPEGTRSQTKKWKTGFYYIAKQAQVPVVPLVINYDKKTLGFGHPVFTTDDLEADIKLLKAPFVHAVGKNHSPNNH